MLSTPSPSRSIQRNQYSTLETSNTLRHEDNQEEIRTWMTFSHSREGRLHEGVQPAPTWCLSSCPPRRSGTRQSQHNWAALLYTLACLCGNNAQHQHTNTWAFLWTSVIPTIFTPLPTLLLFLRKFSRSSYGKRLQIKDNQNKSWHKQ